MTLPCSPEVQQTILRAPMKEIKILWLQYAQYYALAACESEPNIGLVLIQVGAHQEALAFLRREIRCRSDGWCKRDMDIDIHKQKVS